MQGIQLQAEYLANYFAEHLSKESGTFCQLRLISFLTYPCRLDRNGYRVYTQHDSCHGLFRKEVIQPQVLLRLPCYDFTPIMSHTLGRFLLSVWQHRTGVALVAGLNPTSHDTS